MADQVGPRGGGPPRVLFVIGQLDPGGSELQLTELLEHVHPDRVTASVAALRPSRGTRLTDRLRAAGIEPQALSRGTEPRVIADVKVAHEIHRLIRTLRPDAVYSWLEEASLVSVPVARACRVPALVARRNVCGSSLERFSPMRVAIRRAERLALVVTANSSAVGDVAVQRGIERRRIRVVQNGHAAVPPLPMPTADTVALGYLAHLRNEKGHFRLLEALARLRTTTPWRIDLAGNGALEPRIRSEIARRGLADKVSLVGPIDDPRAFWRSREVAVLLSDYEGSPNALIEAALAGRPLVGTDSGGTLDVVGPGTGFLVALDDPDAGAEALRRLIEDRELRERMGLAAHDHAAARFSLQQFVDGHLGAIDAALSEAQRRV